MQTISAVTLGCKVNQYDTRAMLDLFIEAGFAEVPYGEPSDVVLVNTCTVTGEADRKSRQYIRRSLQQNPEAYVIVSGCLSQRSPQAFADMGVKLVMGTKRRAEVVELLNKVATVDGAYIAVDNARDYIYEETRIAQSVDGRTRAVIKVQDGCDQMCAYCAIPLARGRSRSRSVEAIREEAARLQGYKEISIVGINLSAYGMDGNGGASLADVIRDVATFSKAARIRLGSLEPTLITPEFVGAIASVPELAPHFPLALQSGCDATLRRMRRRYTTEEYMNAAALLREAFPGCAITTDIMTGFPGETDKEFNETLAFVERVKLSRMHVFPYSAREKTLAARMEGQVPPKVRQSRAKVLGELGRRLEAEYISRMVGKVKRVLIEEDDELSGYTGEYVRVRLDCSRREPTREHGEARDMRGQIVDTLIVGVDGDCAVGEFA